MRQALIDPLSMVQAMPNASELRRD